MNAVVFNSVSKRFEHRPALFNWLGRERGGATEALRRISLHVPKGEALVLLGPNGSGKTTTLKLISTMLIPDEGTVAICGADTLQEGGTVRRKVGFAAANERSFFPRLTARENLDFFAVLEDVPRQERSARVEEKLGLTGLGDAGDTLVMKFSSGMYQRLGVARALLKNPEVLLLDEPTRSLDPGSALRFWPFVRELLSGGTTLVLTTHNFQEAAAVADRIVVLRRGELRSERAFGRSTGTDQPGTDQPGTDQPSTDRPSIDPPRNPLAGDCRPSIEEVKAFYFEASGDGEDAPAFETAL
jgi:ABC-2 type transport system ATP-binding protein